MAFPDVLDLVRDYLATQASPTPAVTRVPDPRPATFIQLRQGPGTEVRPVRVRQVFDVYAWSETSEVAAQTLGLSIHDWINALSGSTTLGITCYRVEVPTTPHPVDDLLTGVYRSRATYALTVRADDAIH